MSRELVIREPEPATPATLEGVGQAIIPATVADAGEQASYRFFEFFTANIRNPNTRRAYHRAACGFFAWTQERRLPLASIRPPHVAAYVEELLAKGQSRPSVKQALAGVLVDVEAATSVVRSAAWTAVHRPDDLPVAAAVARAWCSAAYRRAAATNIQVHGGIGFTWDHDAHLHFKRAVSSALLLGNPAGAREVVAHHLGL